MNRRTLLKLLGLVPFFSFTKYAKATAPARWKQGEQVLVRHRFNPPNSYGTVEAFAAVVEEAYPEGGKWQYAVTYKSDTSPFEKSFNLPESSLDPMPSPLSVAL